MNNAEFKTSLEIAYDRQAVVRDAIPKDDWKAAERAVFLSALQERNAKTVLEIGAGTGQDSLFFNQQGMETTSIDMSGEMVRLCREKNLTAFQMDFYHLDFPTSSFDAVWALNCLLHVPRSELETVLLGVKNVLKIGGLFYLGVYGGKNSEGVWEDDTYEPKRFFSFHTDHSIRTVVSRHFEVLYFNTVDYGNASLHFQSIILEKRDVAQEVR